MKKKDLYKDLVNKMVEKHGIDYDYLKDHEEIDGKPWYLHYTWTEEEQNEFIIWAVDYVAKHKKCGTYYAERIVQWFIGDIGLTINNEI